MEDEVVIIASFCNWLKILPYMKEQGYQIITYDVKGHKISYFKKALASV